MFPSLTSLYAYAIIILPNELYTCNIFFLTSIDYSRLFILLRFVSNLLELEEARINF